jgi:hypothetical protein
MQRCNFAVKVSSETGRTTAVCALRRQGSIGAYRAGLLTKVERNRIIIEAARPTSSRNENRLESAGVDLSLPA